MFLHFLIASILKILTYVCMLKRKLLIFEHWSSDELSKIGHHFRKIKWFENWCYQKMAITNNMLLNSFEFNEKKIRKILIIFDKEKWLWKSNFGTTPLHQFAKFNNFVWVGWFLAKNLFNFIYIPWKLHNRYCHT